MKHFSTTNYTNWLRRGIRIAMLLAIFNCQFSIVNSVRAQDAFYVYRNDGDFNGFFYDQVIRMGYSKFDLEGVEHDKYVVQEVETEDSIYRIPLAAIDSIGFQQPEIIFNPKLRNMDAEGITDYISGEVFHDGLYLRMDIPEKLLPKPGEVIVTFDSERVKNADQYPRDYWSQDHEYGGFGGKVVSVERIDHMGIYRVGTERLTSIGDIFQQFITVEQVGTDEQGQARRRIAGFDYDEKNRRWVRRGKSGSGNLTLLDFSGTLHNDISVGSSGTASIDLGVKLKVSLDMTYNISWNRIFFKLGKSFGIGLTPGATLKTSASFDGEIEGIPRALASIKFPAVAPLFQTRPLPKAFLRGGGDLAVKLTLPQVGFTHHEDITFDSDLLLPFRYHMFSDGPSEAQVEDNVPFNTGNLEMSLSGFLQIGAKFSANIETNDWISDIIQTNVSLDIYVGPKIEGNVSLSAATLSQPNAAYNTLKGCEVTLHPLSVDVEATGYYKMFWSNGEKMTFFEGSESFFPQKWSAVCSFDSIKAVFDQKNQRVDAVTYPSGRTFLNNNIGLGLYDYQGIRLAESPSTASYFLAQTIKEFRTTFDTKKLACGYYFVRPFIKLGKYNIEVEDGYPVLIGPTIRVDEDKKKLELNGDKQTIEVGVIVNAKEVRISFFDEEMHSVSSQQVWAKGKLSEIDKELQFATLTIDVGKNASFWEREGYMVLTAVAEEYTASDTISIKQAAFFTGFKRATGQVSVSATNSRTYRSWGHKYDEWTAYTDFDDTNNHSYESSVVGYLSYSDIEQNINISRQGNVFTLTSAGSNSQPINGGSKTETLSWTLVVDLTEKPGKLLSGMHRLSSNSKWDYDTEQKVFEGTPQEYVKAREHSDGVSQYEENLTWSHIVPCTRIEQTEDGGSMVFYLVVPSMDNATGGGKNEINSHHNKIGYNGKEVSSESQENVTQNEQWTITNKHTGINITLEY